MSQTKKIERVLDLLINEDVEKAEQLLHSLVVEKARIIYEGLVNEEDDDLDDESDEDLGGDVTDDFGSDIEADVDDIESDEIADGEADEFDADLDDEEGDFEGDEDMDVEDRVDSLEDQLASLQSEFEQLMGDEMEEPYHDAEEFGREDELDGDEFGDDEFGGEDDEMEFGVDGGDPEMDIDFSGGEFGDDELMQDDIGGEPAKGKGKVKTRMYYEELDEATKLQDTVADPGMKKEGKLAGTGKHSKTGATGTASPYTKAPSKRIQGESAVDWNKGGTGGEYSGPAGGDTTSAKDHTPSDNIGEEPKGVSHKEQKSEGDFVGTGKNSKKGATNAKSPLSKAPK